MGMANLNTKVEPSIKEISKNGQIHGQGALFFSNGDKYIGQWGKTDTEKARGN